MQDLEFINDSTGWAVDGDLVDLAGTSRGVILHTTDGGETWQEQLNIPNQLNAVDFVNENKGWVVGRDGMKKLTYNGGISGTTQNSPISGYLTSVCFVDENEGWISSSSGAEIYHTTDGGETFEIQTTSLGTSTAAIYMIDENEGFTGGGSGFVYRTIDGGVNWNFHGAMSSSLNNMDFARATQGYCCGNGGKVFSIAPAGVTNLNTGQPTNFSGISSPSVNNVWLCGGNDIMYFNGSTWEFQSGPVGSYNSIFFINDDEGWVVGNYGLIGHTVNGGDTWTSQTNPEPDLHSLYDLFFMNENEGWAVGSQGTILKTSDGGVNWQVEGAGLITNFLRGVHFTSPTNGYVVGNGKTLLKYGQLSTSVNQ